MITDEMRVKIELSLDEYAAVILALESVLEYYEGNKCTHLSMYSRYFDLLSCIKKAVES